MNEPTRYLIAETSTHRADRVTADWDGEIYNDRARAEVELAEANGKDGCCGGEHWRLYAVVPVDSVALPRNCACVTAGADKREHIDGQCLPRYITGG